MYHRSAQGVNVEVVYEGGGRGAGRGMGGGEESMARPRSPTL